MIEGMKIIYILFDEHHFKVQNSFHSPSIPFTPSEHNLIENSIRKNRIPPVKELTANYPICQRTRGKWGFAVRHYLFDQCILNRKTAGIIVIFSQLFMSMIINTNTIAVYKHPYSIIPPATFVSFVLMNEYCIVQVYGTIMGRVLL